MNTGLYNYEFNFCTKDATITTRTTFADTTINRTITRRKDRIASEQRAMERKRKGRKSTILTGPLGDTEEAETEKKTLLGS